MYRYKTDLNLDLTLSSGQCFRWKKINGSWHGVVRGFEEFVYREGKYLVFENSDEVIFNNIFYEYFDFSTDYGKILKTLSNDENVQNYVEKNGKLAILRQESFETLISFIISACNNIPRIMKIIDNLCKNFGENNAFPSPEKLASLTVEDLSVIRAGFRADYIINAAKAVASKEIDLEYLEKCDTETVRKELMKLKGVGRKVADCTLLYGFHRLEVAPVDRHINRIFERLYPNGLPECFEEYAGVAQQYLFVEESGVWTAS